MEAGIHATEVDLGGLLTVLGSHLYSTPAVAVRELVQNAHDSITRRRIEDPGFEGGRIELEGDPGRGLLVVRDDGAGMTRDEVARFLATIGAGATREARERGEAEEDLIGLFGLGFLSAFIIADRTRVRSTSHKAPGEGVEYRSTTGERYALADAEPRPPGTEVELELGGDHRPLSDPATLRSIVARYCGLLDVPVLVGGEPVNSTPPPWRDPDAPSTPHPAEGHRRRRAFAQAFDPSFEPVCFVDVEPEEALGSDARGLLWVQDAATYGGSDNRRLAVYVRGMLVDDDARELLPRWAGFVSGVVESRALTPTASREELQRDRVYDAVRTTLKEDLVAGLSTVAREQPEAWSRVLHRHNEALLGAALADERVEALVADDLFVPTSDGDMSARELLEAGGGRAHVGMGEGGFEEMRFRALKVPIALGTRYAVLPFLRRWCEAQGAELVEIGTERGDGALFRRAELPEAERAWLAEQLAGDGDELIPAAFEPEGMPFVLVPDREAELKKRLEDDEADGRIAASALHLARLHTETIAGGRAARLYVNVGSPAVAALLAAHRRGADTEAATGLLRAVLSLIAAGERNVRSGIDLGAAMADIGAAVSKLAEEA